MRSKLLGLATAIALTLPPLGGSLPAAAIDYLPFVTVNAAPEGAQAMAGEHFEGVEFTNSRPLREGAVGPLPVFFADDQFGCMWTTAQSSGILEWIGLAQRSAAVGTGSDPCSAFQEKLTAATLAGADALIVINNTAGTELGTAAGTIPGAIIDQTQGGRLRDSLSASNPNAVKVTLGLLEPGTFLPPGALRPTTVDYLEASVSDGTVTVLGAAILGNQLPVTLAEDGPGDAPVIADLGDDTGVDLLAGKVSQPDPSDPTLVFEWHLVSLPAAGVPPPEVVRYNFPFKIAEKQFQLQAKLTNLASVTLTDDPAGHVEHAGSSFQLRGNCAPGPGGIINCPHIAWLSGAFDAAADVVRISLPIGASFAPEVVPGALLETNPVAAGTIVAAYQAVVSRADTWDEAIWEPEVTYAVPTYSASLGMAPAGTDPSEVGFETPASLSSDGTLSGTIDASGLSPGDYDVWVRACFASNCGTRMMTVTI